MAVDTTALTKLMDERSTGVTIESGGYQYFAYTLDGVLGYWVVSALLAPYQMNGQDPITATKIFALNFCHAHPGVDCSNIDDESLAFGNFLQAAMNGQPLPPLPPPPFSTGTGPYKTIPGVVHSDVPPIPAPPPPIDQSVPSPTLQALMTTAPASTPAPAATPAPTPTPTATPTSVPVPPLQSTGLKPKFIAAGGAAGGAAAGLPEAAATFGISIVVGAILGALFGSLFGGSDTKALQQAVNQLRTALAQTADELERFSWSIAVGLGRLWQAVAEIWDNFLDGLWASLKQLWKLLSILVSKVVPAIINVLRDLRKFLDTIYQKYILPAMRYMLLIRQVLILLRALHIPIAAKLDKILGQIQAALYVPFLALATIANGYGAWINTILTNRYTLQRGVFLRTMWAYQSDWINVWWLAQTPTLAASVVAPAAGAGAPSQEAAVLAEQNLYLTTGAGPMAADVADADAIMAATWAGQA